MARASLWWQYWQWQWHRHRVHPYHFWKLEDIYHWDCYSWSGLSKVTWSSSLYTGGYLPHSLLHRAIPILWKNTSSFSCSTCIKGFTGVAHHTFGYNPWHFSAIRELIVNYLYSTFYHKISGRSLDQWIPVHLNTCWRLIHNVLSTIILNMIFSMHSTMVISVDIDSGCRWYIFQSASLDWSLSLSSNKMIMGFRIWVHSSTIS